MILTARGFSELWTDLFVLPRQDVALLKEVLRMTNKKNSPAKITSVYAHSAEIQSWTELDRSSFEGLTRTLRISNIYILNVDGTAYFLPILIALCFLRKDRMLQHTLVEHLSDSREQILLSLDRESLDLIRRLIERMRSISWSTQQETWEIYPSMSIALDFEVEGFVEFAVSYFLGP
ncbi:MAG: hypothetical protein EON58_02570 [Alphaproteobacteria bacterium]|nr:MAG: hypothetical protein EON58_02570 [Alphaproteobacteria bacterium]